MDPGPAPSRKLHPTVFDTGAMQIAAAYALALYNAATTGKQVDAVLEEYDSFVHDVLDNNPDFERTLSSTIIARGDKAATIRRIVEGKASTAFLNFLLVLNDHGRLALLRPALREVHSIHDARLGRIPVEVSAAVELDAAERQAISATLRGAIGGEPVIHSRVDPSLVAGLVVRIGDKVYDGSVRTQLRRLREQILQRSTHEIQSRRVQFSPPA